MKDLWKAQEEDVSLMVVKKLMGNEEDILECFPRSLKKKAKHFSKSKKKRLYEKSHGVPRCKWEPSERKPVPEQLVSLAAVVPV